MDFMEKVKEEDTYTYMNVEAYKTLSVGLKDLLRRMLQCNPRNRITAGGILVHLYRRCNSSSLAPNTQAEISNSILQGWPLIRVDE